MHRMQTDVTQLVIAKGSASRLVPVSFAYIIYYIILNNIDQRVANSLVTDLKRPIIFLTKNLKT